LWDVTPHPWAKKKNNSELKVHLTLENESNTFLRNAGNHSPKDAASQNQNTTIHTVPLWEPQNTNPHSALLLQQLAAHVCQRHLHLTANTYVLLFSSVSLPTKCSSLPLAYQQNALHFHYAINISSLPLAYQQNALHFHYAINISSLPLAYQQNALHFH
jgi:hypothetical protein